MARISYVEKDNAPAEVTEKVSASQESIDELRKYFDDSQIAELNLVIGAFNVLTRFADTFKVDLER